ncbi:18677_t:CDS:2, partial [Rhizophagus irregularis]
CMNSISLPYFLFRDHGNIKDAELLLQDMNNKRKNPDGICPVTRIVWNARLDRYGMPDWTEI